MLELSMHILDIVENSVTAGASEISLCIEENKKKNILSIKIEDNGSGMDEVMLNKALDPFTTTKKDKKVGLGLSLLSNAAHGCGGDMRIDSLPGKGTTIKAVFGLNHIDRQPLGDIIETMIVLIVGHSEVEFIFQYIKDGNLFSWDTRKIQGRFGDVYRSNPEVLDFIRNELDQINRLVESRYNNK